MTSKILLLILVLISLSVFLIFQIVSNRQLTVHYTWPVSKNRIRYILYWGKMWTYEDFGLGLGGEIFKNCPTKNCFATNDQNLIPIEQYDALVIHAVTYRESRKSNPPVRNTQQVYIHYSLESPFNTPTYLDFSHWFFNWTMGYR